MRGTLEHMQLMVRLRSWQARRDFRHKLSQLVAGMSVDEVRQLFGEPKEIIQYDDELDIDTTWHYNHVTIEGADFVLGFKAGKYSHAWNRQPWRRKY